MFKLQAISKRVLECMVVLCLAGMVALVFLNVVLRYVFNSGISISEELSRFLFVWLIFAGAIVAAIEGAHLGMDSVVKLLPRRGMIAFAVISDILVIACCVLLAHGAWVQAGLNMSNASPVSGLPLGIMYVACLFASIGIGIVAIGHLWRILQGKATQSDLIQVRESEDEIPVAIGKNGAKPS